MNAIFVDSSVWIDHFRGVLTPGVRALQALLVALNPDTGEDEPTQIFMGDLVLLEVLRGILDDRQHERTRRILLAFPQVELAGTATALAAVDHSRALRRQGITVRAGNHCAEPLMRRLGVDSSARASTGVYTTIGEIDALADTLIRVREFFG